ncbi:MAG: bifunctional serine/threonine-protein kinase/universal stress protein [Pseudomonadota bacterium]
MSEVDAPATHRNLQPGMEVDGYRLEEKLHTGGMAGLWRITDLQERHGVLGQTKLIMKVPRLFSSDDPTAIVAFEVEQMIMPKLKGKHVPRFFGAGDFDAQPYIVMEQIEGASLRARLDESPLPWQDVVQIGIKVAQALQELHRQHVIHFDIKPSNIMLRPDGTAVLIDFGLSRHDQLPDLLDEEFHLPFGTGPYISPEQVLSVRNEPRSDLFSLGVLMYHMATGQRPYGQPSKIAGLKKRIYRDPIPPRVHRPDIPPWFQEVILRCLETMPANRFDTPGQLAFMLQNSEQLPLTARAEKMHLDSVLTVFKRRLKMAGMNGIASQSAAGQLNKAPIVMVALDLNGASDLAASVRDITERMLQSKLGARLACLTVRKVNRLGMDDSLIQGGQNVHVKQLAQLKNWARPLGLGPERITFHVLEATDPATAIVAYANDNSVDHIVVGARGSSTLRRYLGSVSSQVVAEANCTVTVVKVEPGNGA